MGIGRSMGPNHTVVLFIRRHLRHHVAGLVFKQEISNDNSDAMVANSRPSLLRVRFGAMLRSLARGRHIDRQCSFECCVVSCEFEFYSLFAHDAHSPPCVSSRCAGSWYPEMA